MNSTPLNLILGQSYLHFVSYGLVAATLFVAIADAWLIGHLRKVLRSEGAHVRDGDLNACDLIGMMHPVASGLSKSAGALASSNLTILQRKVDLAEAALFVPLRARMTLTRDLSTLMGLIATLLALVAAASDFARHGKPEMLVGSVGTGCVATCVAAIGCAIALWNLSRLTRLRLAVACDAEAVFAALDVASEPTVIQEIPILHVEPGTIRALNVSPQENHAPL